MQELLHSLESLRNETTYAHNTKYGATKQYGVKLGDIRKIANSVRKDNATALLLWNTGIAEAQLLGTLISKPKEFTEDELDNMVQTIHFSQVADWFQAYILKDRTDKLSLYKRWIEYENTWAQRAAWSLLSGFLTRKEYDFDLDKILADISDMLPTAVPEVQWTMNGTLAQIGIHYPTLRQRAINLGENMGLYRDYPVSKGCTSPFAPIWIEEMVKRNAKDS
ncbi:DNA alkylation repair protein [Sphingobacterium sp. lm-10]|uniref:DNA alkylation repair protein n=1 Tax=Sphingobacterium sp. lm-10 TaxID=2944904 RepID=UPI002020A412|nr:DNA alkylation repair protein [Sphingobacterium sp. lm-10]MCL7988034.1 DNA alkylation repair protein [Sphingobacterium sp. lm-10]